MIKRGTKLNFTEIEKLHTLLTEDNIPHTFKPLWDGMQIKLYSDETLTNELDDAILHSYSHGGADGLLETCCLGDCEGRETAEQVFKGWKKMYKKAKRKG